MVSINMNLPIELIKKHPFSISFTIIYTFLWIMIFRIPFRHPEGSIAAGEGQMYGIIFASMIATISVVTTILLALLKKESKFYGYLSAYILVPLIIVLLGTYVF